MAGKRTSKIYAMKTLRFPPEMIEDAERVLFLTRDGKYIKYPSLNNLIVTALEQLITKERRELEKQGVVWEHLGHTKQSNKKE